MSSVPLPEKVKLNVFQNFGFIAQMSVVQFFLIFTGVPVCVGM